MSYAHLFYRFNHPVDTAGWGFLLHAVVYSQGNECYSVFYIQGASG